MYADDILLYRKLDAEQDYAAIQKDVDALESIVLDTLNVDVEMEGIVRLGKPREGKTREGKRREGKGREEKLRKGERKWEWKQK